MIYQVANLSSLGHLNFDITTAHRVNTVSASCYIYQWTFLICFYLYVFRCSPTTMSCVWKYRSLKWSRCFASSQRASRLNKLHCCRHSSLWLSLEWVLPECKSGCWAPLVQGLYWFHITVTYPELRSRGYQFFMYSPFTACDWLLHRNTCACLESPQDPNRLWC